jgi:hypothetical protein
MSQRVQEFIIDFGLSLADKLKLLRIQRLGLHALNLLSRIHVLIRSRIQEILKLLEGLVPVEERRKEQRTHLSQNLDAVL